MSPTTSTSTSTAEQHREPRSHRKPDTTIQLPAHASPALPPLHSPQVRPPSHVFDLRHDDSNGPPPPSIISPAFTPPLTPSISGRQTPLLQRPSTSIPVDTSLSTTPGPALLEQLPIVECQVRARIPTTTGQEMWLHLYTNDHDNKEHLAIVFGSTIRSASLDRPRDGETEFDRMVRGAYVGRLWPGRVSSRVEQQAKPGESSSSNINADNSAEAAAVKEEGEEEFFSDSTSTSTSHIPPLVRIHSECYTGETVWSARCDCGEQLDEAARLMSLRDTVSPTGGAIVYLRQEGRGIGLGEKLKAYNLQDLGNDTYEANLLLRHPADARSYGLATSILVDLGLGREGGDVGNGGSRGARGIRLLTNNPDKVRAVEGPRREVVVRERVAMVPLAWKTGGKMGVQGEEVERYLSTKIEKFKHMLEMK